MDLFITYRLPIAYSLIAIMIIGLVGAVVVLRRRSTTKREERRRR